MQFGVQIERRILTDEEIFRSFSHVSIAQGPRYFCRGHYNGCIAKLQRTIGEFRYHIDRGKQCCYIVEGWNDINCITFAA